MQESSAWFKNGRTWITGIGGGGATPTATTGREVAKAAIDGPKKAAATSSGNVIRPQSANLDGVSGMGIGQRWRPRFPVIRALRSTYFEKS